MKRLALACLLLATPLAAQEPAPPVASIADWSLGAPPVPATVSGRRAGLADADAALSAVPVPQADFILEATLTYDALADGDVAGLALRGTNGGWISLQLEQVTPALLIAVRQHVPGGIAAHGQLLATTAVPGWHAGRIRLRIARRSGMLYFAHAPTGGAWQHLGPAFADPTRGTGQAGVFAIDGAERSPLSRS